MLSTENINVSLSGFQFLSLSFNVKKDMSSGDEKINLSVHPNVSISQPADGNLTTGLIEFEIAIRDSVNELMSLDAKVGATYTFDVVSEKDFEEFMIENCLPLMLNKFSSHIDNILNELGYPPFGLELSFDKSDFEPG